MSNLLTVRLNETDKEALALSSHLSKMPVSKLILPFLSEGTKITLGAVLIFRIDTTVYKKERLMEFLDLIMSPTKKGSTVFYPVDPGELQRQVPKVIWEFFDLLERTRTINRINSSFEEVEITTDAAYVGPEFLRTLCFNIGESYLSMGGGLESMNYQLANEIFFQKMLFYFYRFNAKGTTKSLTTQWYAHNDLISKISGEMNDIYSEKAGSRVMEAIVVAPQRKKKGRKRKKKALPPGPQVVAKEIR